MPQRESYIITCLPHVLFASLDDTDFSSQSRHECAQLTWQKWDGKSMTRR
jgi:hypothetical protein